MPRGLSYRGLTWDHPRGVDALRASVAQPSPSGIDITVDWAVHPLAGFESSSIAAIASEHDLLVIDHPHLGAAVASDALLPLDAWFGVEEVEALRRASIGETLESYRLDGHLWALPLDAAAQVAVGRRDLGDVPADWDDVEELSRHRPVALSLAGPHALATFASACCAFGVPLATGEAYVAVADGAPVLERLTALARRAPAGSADLDPIQMLAVMLEPTTTIDYVPLVFGYVAASTPGPGGLAFTDAPTAPGGSRHGSVLGGAGLALSRRCEVTEELLAYLRWLVSDEVQRRFVPGHAGQPSAVAAWHDDDVDSAAGGFYAQTRRTLEHAWVRPRHDGSIAFQAEASQVVRQVLAGQLAPTAGVGQINDLYQRSLVGAALVGAAS